MIAVLTNIIVGQNVWYVKKKTWIKLQLNCSHPPDQNHLHPYHMYFYKNRPLAKKKQHA